MAVAFGDHHHLRRAQVSTSRTKCTSPASYFFVSLEEAVDDEE